MTSARRIPTALVCSLLLASSVSGQQHEHGGSADDKVGTVSFATSCSGDAQRLFNRTVALLHSFEFGRALDGFAATLKADPSCAMAEWGVALTRWSNPFSPGLRAPAVLQQGRDAVNRARALTPKTERERAYVDAVAQLYDGFESVDQRTRILAYRDAMNKVAAANPKDTEAAIFYALAIAAAASPNDKTYAEQLKAGKILEQMIANQPDHPGLAHYIIHSYDVPPLAPRALSAARRYAKIAPSAPHALHMPSHTFTRVGSWQESIEANTASAEVARREGSTAEELHTMDYRTYAYLQTGQDAAARKLLEGLPEVRARFNPDAIGSAAPGSAGVFALAAIPARNALEHGAWGDAVKLEPQPSRYLYPEGLTHFARALGAARSGDAATARAAIDALQTIQDQLTQQKEAYWAEQTDIQRRSAAAWLALLEGHKEEALADMRHAAALEDGTEKAAVTPGPLAPSRELLGEMLLQLGRTQEALDEFERTLQREPNRFRSVYGAARAASLAGHASKARSYYESLLKICARADGQSRPELVEARDQVTKR
jgi:tetratricopeptide (TPR) repeat protein